MANVLIGSMAHKDSNGNVHIINFDNQQEDPKPITPSEPTPGTPGYGTGTYPGSDLDETLGLTPMEGCDDPSSDNYGNYQNSDGSVFVFIPKFYYSFNCKPSDTYYNDTLTYSGLNEDLLAQIVTRSPNNYMAFAPSTAFENEAEANEHGFILHRAFIDGGQEKTGFFIAKYLASRGTDGNSTKALFVKNGKTISLTTSSNYIPSSNMPNCNGNLKDAIILSKAINSNLNCASAFMYSALAMQSKFIGSIVTNTSQCAWYDSNLTMNYPKGCNNSLEDYDDSSVTYTAQYSTKPLTGSGTPFAKTTHNGLNSGVCDLNGCLWQVVTGVGWAGTRILDNNSKLTDITVDNVDSQDGNGTPLYIQYNTGYTDNPYYWGNSSSSSWRKDINGASRALEGIYPVSASAGCSSNGLTEFGEDYCNADTGNSALLCSGDWNDGSSAGVFDRFNYNWSNYHYNSGFRSGGYALN